MYKRANNPVFTHYPINLCSSNLAQQQIRALRSMSSSAIQREWRSLHPLWTCTRTPSHVTLKSISHLMSNFTLSLLLWLAGTTCCNTVRIFSDTAVVARMGRTSTRQASHVSICASCRAESGWCSMPNIFTSSAFTPLVFDRTEDDTEATYCAWCISERGETPNENHSHGICQQHRDTMYASATAGREQRRNRRNR